MSINGVVWVSILFRKGVFLGTNLVHFNSSLLLSCMVRNLKCTVAVYSGIDVLQ